MKLVLLHSPLTGPAIWDRLAPLLRKRGHDVAVADYANALRCGPPFYDAIVRGVGRSLDGARQILIAHSGAGVLVPTIASAGSLQAAIFMDALLPHPGCSWFDTVSLAMKQHLQTLVRNGRLPR